MNIISKLGLVSLFILGLSFGCEKKDTAEKSGTKETSVITTSTPEKPTSCESFNNRPYECMKSPLCYYDKITKKCEEAQADKKNTCASIQLEESCEKSKLDCRWDKPQNLCIKKQAEQQIAQVQVHVWKKLNNPADVNPDFSKVVTSEDGKIYALNKAAGAEGLWYKEKDKASWDQLNNLTGQPEAGADSTTLDISPEDINNNKIKLYATKEGAVIQKNKQLIVLKNKAVVWALDTSKHNSNANGPNKISDVVNLDINFSAVVNTGGQQAVFFQQDPNTKLAFHYISFASTENIKTMQLKKEDGSNLNIKIHAAAHDSNNGLILGGQDKSMLAARTWQLFHIPPQNNDPNNASKFGIADTNDPVLFSNPAALSATWPNDAKPMTLVGEIGEYYFANLLSDTQNGLLSHKGPQKPATLTSLGSDPVLTFAGETITDVIKFNNALLVATKDHGLLGANNKLEPDPAHNFNFQTFRDSKTEMMDNKQALDSALNNQDLITILQSNNNQETYFVIRNVGIYIRSTLMGAARP